MVLTEAACAGRDESAEGAAVSEFQAKLNGLFTMFHERLRLKAGDPSAIPTHLPAVTAGASVEAEMEHPDAFGRKHRPASSRRAEP